jgi:hypothetical protein
MLHNAVYSGCILSYSMLGVTVFLADLRSRRGLMTDSGFRRQAALRLLYLSGDGFEGCLGRRLCQSSSVRQSRVRPCLFEGLAVGEDGELWWHRRWHDDVLSTQGAIALGWLHSVGDGHIVSEMAAQCRRWWRRRTPRSPCRGAARTVCSVAARGHSQWEDDGSRWYSVVEWRRSVRTGRHGACTTLRWLYSDRLATQWWCLRCGMGEDFPFDYNTYGGLGHLMPLSGGMGGAPSVEGRPRARRRFVRGARDPRARQKLTRGVRDPQAKRRLIRGRPVPSSEVEIGRAVGIFVIYFLIILQKYTTV